MQPSDIAAAYDRIAERWIAPGFDRNNGMAEHAQALALLDGGRTALDVGCGASGRFIELFLARGLSVEGLDISPRMLSLARQRHPQVIFHEADICTWPLPRQYDLISAWDSIWHVPLAALESVISKLLAGLTPGGVLIFTTGGPDHPEELIDYYMGPPMYYASLGETVTRAVMTAAGCDCRVYARDEEGHACVIAQRAPTI